MFSKAREAYSALTSFLEIYRNTEVHVVLIEEMLLAGFLSEHNKV